MVDNDRSRPALPADASYLELAQRLTLPLWAAAQAVELSSVGSLIQ